MPVSMLQGLPDAMVRGRYVARSRRTLAAAMKYLVFAIIVVLFVSGCAATRQSGLALCSSDNDSNWNTEQKATTYAAVANSYRLSGEDAQAERYDQAARKLRWQESADDVGQLDDFNYWVTAILNGLIFGGQSCAD